MRWPKTCIAFGGPVDTQEIPLEGRCMDVYVPGDNRCFRYDYVIVNNQRIVAVFAGVIRERGT